MEFVAQIENLPQMLGFLTEQAKTVGIDGQCLGNIELASEEALVNVVHYAFPTEQSNEHILNVTCQFSEPHKFVVTIRDAGKPFDPTAQKIDIQTDVPAEERALGGLGIFMMRKLVDNIEYTRINDENILSLTWTTKS